jgi:hypothetical protein
MVENGEGNTFPGAPGWSIRILWGILGVFALSLFVVSGVLLFKTDLFSSDGHLTDEQFKAIWAFVGVALGGVVTLIGALLTEQNSRRNAALAQQAADRDALAKDQQLSLAQTAEARLQLDAEHQQDLAKETENRLKLDTVARVLELITLEDKYAPEARVAGAIATMMQLRGDVVAIRILRALWSVDKIDANTAVWLASGVLGNPEAKPEELIEAASLLAANAEKLVPAPTDGGESWLEWPAVLRDSWPAHLPVEAKNSLVIMAVKVLLARDPNYWSDRGDRSPIRMLRDAREDVEVGDVVSHVLLAIFDALGADGLAALGLEVDDAVKASLQRSAAGTQLTSWFTQLLSQFVPWAKGGATTSNLLPH